MRIDRYHENTGDKAHVGRHYYTDKAPGASLTAVPAVALARVMLRAGGVDVESKPAIVSLSYVATLTAAALPAVVAAVCVFGSRCCLARVSAAAAIGCLVCGVATPLWPYATLLYGHALAGGCLTACSRRPSASRGQPAMAARHRLAHWLCRGLGGRDGYPAIIPGGIILLFALWRCWERIDVDDREYIVMGVGLAGRRRRSSPTTGRPLGRRFTSATRAKKAMKRCGRVSLASTGRSGPSHESSCLGNIAACCHWRRSWRSHRQVIGYSCAARVAATAAIGAAWPSTTSCSRRDMRTGPAAGRTARDIWVRRCRSCALVFPRCGIVVGLAAGADSGTRS